MNTFKYEPSAGTSIDTAAAESNSLAQQSGEEISFDFNGVQMTAIPSDSYEETRLKFRASMNLPAVDPPFHPQTAAEALERWDKGQTVFTIEMGGLGPGYEQAIQVLVFEIIRDNLAASMPDESDKEKLKSFYSSFGESTVTRIDEKMGGYSGAMVGAAKQIAYRALRDGWQKTLDSVPKDRLIQVSNHVPNLNPQIK
jgi:hypothetical protein